MNHISNQHYVPRVYMREFTLSKKPKIVYAFRPHDERGPSKIEPRSIKSIGSFKELYEIDSVYQELTDHNVLTNTIETQAFWYEDRFLRDCIQRFQTDTCTPQNFCEIAYLAYELKRRHPLSIERGTPHLSPNRPIEILQEILKADSTERLKQVSLYQYFEECNRLKQKVAALQAYDRSENNLSKHSLLQPVSRELMHEHLSKLLAGNSYRLIAAEDYPFVSNDNPSCTWTKNGGVKHTGFGNWDEHYFIVNPTTAMVNINARLIQEIDKVKFYSIQALQGSVDTINLVTCWNAYKYVYSGCKQQLTRVRQAWISATSGG